MTPERWKQVSDLFHAAAARPPGDRPAFLESACAGDHSLRQEVESLLNAHQNAGGFIDTPAFATVASLLDDEPEAGIAGRLIGPYRIERLIGQGGMGVVFLAEDTKLGRKVAIKALPARFALDERHRERLRREARAAASLSHPGIATVYELEEAGDDLYIVFEYVEGQTLRMELGQGPFPLGLLLTTALQIARALAAAHAAGIAHRDLKPENVIRCQDGTVKILDFGLARVQTTGPMIDVTSTRLTAAGSILGTPGYMAPEQIEGKAVDGRADLFAFGVMMYELASGTHPFEGSTPLSTIARILELEPQALSLTLPDCPPSLERIVARCLQKKPDKRYQSATDLVTDLERLQHADVAAPSKSAAETRAAPTAEVRPATGATWWRFHQVATMAVYALLAYPVWLAREATTGQAGLVLFVAYVTCATLNGTIRTHLLFTNRFNSGELPAEIRRSARWRYWSDCGVALLTAAAGALSVGSNVALGAMLVAVAVGCLAAFVIIEPATTRAALRATAGAGAVTTD